MMLKYRIRNKSISLFPDLFEFMYAIRFGLRAYAYRKSGWPSPPDYWVKRSMLLREILRIKGRTFVETGTFLGDTSWFMRKNCKRIVSLELDRDLAILAKYRFRNFPNVEIIEGDSSDLLPDLVHQIESPVLFWLDGHYSGGITACGKKACPIWEELNAISKSGLSFSILIDDAREFSKNSLYPEISEIRNFVKKSIPTHRMYVENDVILIVKDRDSSLIQVAAKGEIGEEKSFQLAEK